MIEIRNLVKNYGKNEAVKNVSFDIENGSILGLLGTNGAGKSTIMNIITGYLAPTSGEVLVDGIDANANSVEVRKKIGYLPELPPLYGDMTVNEYLNFVCDLKGVSAKERRSQLEDIMYTTKIGDHGKRLIKNLSKGYRQRVGFAQALVGNPEIIILDEPTVGLDPSQVREFRTTISKLGRNHTIVLSTHILQEVTAVCSDVVMINHGTIAKKGKISEFTSNNDGKKRMFVSLRAPREECLKVLNEVNELESVVFARAEHDVSVFRVTFDAKAKASEAIFYACAKANMPIIEMKSVEKTLEEEFMSLISAEMAENAETEAK